MKNKIEYIKKNFSVIDWIILGALIFICFICFQHGDILHTGGSSFAYLNGHFKDFYEYNQVRLVGNNYLPTTYWIFAVWNIPLRLFGIVTDSTMDVCAFARMWYKLGTSLFYFATAYILYKICIFKKVSVRNSVLAAFVFLSNPIAIYSEFIFGQYDIITTFFMMLGFYYYLKNKDKQFILFFAVAITCKYFAMLVFLPLLLLKEKDIMKIILKTACAGSLFVIEVLMYIWSAAFRQGVFGFQATGYIFNVGFNNGFVDVSLVLICWVVLCAYAYFKNCDGEDELFKWCIFLCCLVMFICFGMSFWHPQWVLMAVPFLVLGMFFHERPDVFLLVDLLMFAFFIVFVVGSWTNACDQTLFYGGIFRKYLFSYISGMYNMIDLYFFMPKEGNILFSGFVALLCVYCVFVHPKKLCGPENVTVEKYKWILRLRYVGGVLLFLLPAFACVYMNHSEYDVIKNSQAVYEPLDPMDGGTVYEEVFETGPFKLKGLQMTFGTWGKVPACTVKCCVIDKKTGVTLGCMDIDGADIADNQKLKFKFDEPIKLNNKGKYIISLRVENPAPDNLISIYRMADKGEYGKHYARVNGRKKKFDLAVRILGEKM